MGTKTSKITSIELELLGAQIGGRIRRNQAIVRKLLKQIGDIEISPEASSTQTPTTNEKHS